MAKEPDERPQAMAEVADDARAAQWLVGCAKWLVIAEGSAFKEADDTGARPPTLSLYNFLAKAPFRP